MRVSFRTYRGLCVLSLLLCALPVLAAAKAVVCERMGPPSGPLTLVVLHGSSGPDAYRARAKFYADQGYTVLFPHFFDAVQGRSRTDRDYATWIEAIRRCIVEQAPVDRPVVLFGLSLGASIALAAGTHLPNIDAVIDWSGSLPDTYFLHMQQMPPLLILHGDMDTSVPPMNARQLFTLCERTRTACTGTIYHGEGHLFPGQEQDATARTLAFLRARASTKQ